MPDVPVRCLIPRLPDDPKTRFVIDLDNEVIDSDSQEVVSNQWKSVKALDQFWDMMAFRQECSAGRLVGFLWLVVDDDQDQGDNSTAFSWPEFGRGHVILSESDYKAVIDFMLQQEFDKFDLAIASSKAWVDKVSSLADELWWGEPVIGRQSSAPTEAGVEAESGKRKDNLLGAGLVRKKRKKPVGEENGETEAKEAPSGNQQGQGQAVNVLGGSLVRKKTKT